MRVYHAVFCGGRTHWVVVSGECDRRTKRKGCAPNMGSKNMYQGEKPAAGALEFLGDLSGLMKDFS